MNIELNINEYNLPRVWTEEGYYYPVFSELGITYDNPDKEYTEENIKSLNWAFGWHFGKFVKDEQSKDGYKYIQNPDGNINFDYIIEQCTNKKDTNNNLIYENDIVIDEWGNKGIVFYSNHFCRWQIAWYEGRKNLINHSGYGVEMFNWTYPTIHLTVVSNIHKEQLKINIIKN